MFFLIIFMSANIHFKIILSLSLITLCSAENDICNIQSQLTDQQLWNIFAFNSFIFYFILVVGSISILGLFITQITWVWVPSFTLPFDIVFVILISSTIQNATFVVQAAYYNIQQSSSTFSGFHQYCGGLGFLNLLGFVTRLYYNAFFCGGLAYSIQNTLKKPLFSRMKLHLICIVIIVSALLIIIFTDNHNDYFSDLCVYRVINSTSLGIFFFHLVVFMFCLYNLRKFKQKIPQNSFFQKQSHFKYYYIYMVIFCFSQFIVSLTFLISNITCSAQSENSNLLIQILYAINIVIGFLLTFAALYLRLGHPLLRKRWKKPFDQEGIQIFEQDGQELLLVSSLVDSIKGSQVLSFIEAIMMNFIEQNKKYTLDLTPYHFHRQYSFKIDQQITQDYIKRRVTNRESHFIKRSSDGLTTLKYEVLIYTPEFYSWIIKYERINLFSSFDIRKNLCLVKQQSFTQGGKSGEFFFGTYDHKFIFKTIQPEEANVLVQKTQQIYNYFTITSDSLLIKIIGLYRFERKDVSEDNVYLIIMKNLTMTNKSANLRVYDIKGSQFHRSAFKDKKIKEFQEQKIRKYTLKDKDFLLLQEKVQIDPLEAKYLKEVLIKDINFLISLGVMDYSLLIIKRQGLPTHQKGQFRSCKQKDVIYNFGIIDYLEEWTLKKKAQRAFKTLITKEQVTVNSPHAYGQRLISFINKII